MIKVNDDDDVMLTVRIYISFMISLARNEQHGDVS